MILTFNTLEESANYLQKETRKSWTPRGIIQACLDHGVFPHIQILTDRPELPSWMREGGVAELPFNIDLLTFLTGTGVIQVFRRDNIIYKIDPPGLTGDMSDLRLSKDALNKLLACYNRKNDIQISPLNKQREEEILRVIREDLKLDALNLPPRVSGRAWVKSQVKEILKLPSKLFTKSSFDDAWERLRSTKEIQEAP